VTSTEITHGTAPLAAESEPIHRSVDALAAALHEYVDTAIGVRAEFGAADADGDPRLLALEHSVGTLNAALFDELHDRLGVHPDLTCSVWVGEADDEQAPPMGEKVAEEFFLGILVEEPEDTTEMTLDGVVDLMDEAGAWATSKLAEAGYNIVEWAVTRGESPSFFPDEE
jgi:hypothetical protein